jgi:hypothetical protein
MYLVFQLIFSFYFCNGSSLYCKDCQHYRIVRTKNDYSVISELCGAFVKPLDEENTFVSELRNEYENDYWSCIEARISEDMCGANGFNYILNYVTEINKLQQTIHKLNNLIQINKIIDGIE